MKTYSQAVCKEVRHLTRQGYRTDLRESAGIHAQCNPEKDRLKFMFKR